MEKYKKRERITTPFLLLRVQNAVYILRNIGFSLFGETTSWTRTDLEQKE